MQTFKPIAMLSILLLVMSGIAIAQAPEKAYPNPKTGPGEIIEPPGMLPKPTAPKPASEAKPKKEPDSTPVQLDVGAIVIGSDDRNVGRISKVAVEPDGWVKEIHVKLDAVEGAAGKIVVMRAGTFGRAKDGIRLSIPSSAVSKLPVIADQPG